MPNITEYTSQAADQGLRPNDAGVSAYEQEGRRVGQLYHQVGEELGSTVKDLGAQYEAHQTQQYILQAGKHLAELQANHQAAWDQFVKTADPNDHTAVDQFRQSAEKDFTDFAKDAPNDQSRMWAVEQVDRQRQNLYERTASDASTMAGMAAQTNYETMVNTYSSTAYNDYTTVDTSIGTTKAALEAAISSPNITPEQASRLRAEGDKAAAQITFAGLRGAISRNPDAADQLINGDPRAKQYLNQDQRDELLQFGQRTKEAALVDQERQHQINKQNLEDASTAKSNDYLTALGKVDPNTPGFQDKWNQTVLQDPTLLPATKDSLVSMGARLVTQGREGASQGNPELLNSVVSQVAAGKKLTDAQIYDTVGKPGGLSMAQAEFALKIMHPKTEMDQFQNKTLDAEIKAWNSFYPINGPSGIPNAANGKIQADMQTFYLPLIQAGLAAGKSMSDLLAPAGKDHPDSIYNSKALDSWTTPTNAASDAQHQHHLDPQHNLADQVSAVWNSWRDSTSGGASVQTPIAGSVQSAYDQATTARPGQKSLGDIFGGK